MGPPRAKFSLLGLALCSIASHVAGVQVGQVVWQGSSLEQGEYGSMTGGCQEKGKEGPSYWDWGPKSLAEMRGLLWCQGLSWECSHHTGERRGSREPGLPDTEGSIRQWAPCFSS